jgi:hypothetical protein
VVTAIGDKAIDDEGVVQVRDKLWPSFRYLVPKLACGGSVRLCIARAGSTQEIRLPVDHGDEGHDRVRITDRLVDEIRRTARELPQTHPDGSVCPKDHQVSVRP